MQETKNKLTTLPDSCKKQLEDNERQFWEAKVKNTLRPIPEGLTRTDELKNSLKNLRNTALIRIFLINLIWIMLYLMLTFEELKLINVNPRVSIIVFLGIYGVLLMVQFVTMVIHRFTTLAHYIARLNHLTMVQQDKPALFKCLKKFLEI